MQVILFDIDGTLIHTRGAGRAALQQALLVDFNIAQPDNDVPLEGRTDCGITRDLFLRHAIPETPENWLKFRAAYLRHLPRMLHDRPGTVLPGIEPLLQSLAAQPRVSLGLLTGNTREGAHIKLSHYGLAQYFDFGGFGDLHQHRDDVAREALAAARSRHGDALANNSVWVVGDTALDVQCGRAIGARVIAVATGGHTLETLRRAEPDYLYESFAEYAPLQSLWNCGPV